MSWGEVLKINSDDKKSLDILIKEQFNNNFGSSGDVSYIKNTQLGTNVNNLLNGISGSTIDFNNKPLVDKVNYLLLCSDGVKLSSGGSRVFSKKVEEVYVSSSGRKELVRFTAVANGQLYVKGYIRHSSVYSGNGVYISVNGQSRFLFTNNSTSYGLVTSIINVNKGDNVVFELVQKSDRTVYCKEFYVTGSLVFSNPYTR